MSVMLGEGGARRLAAVVAGLLCAMALAGAAHAQRPDDLARLLNEVNRLHGQGRYAEAVPIAERAIAVARTRRGEQHAEFATAIAWLAHLYNSQERYADAEPLYRRSLTIAEKALGPSHPEVASALNNLALTYKALGRPADAEPLYERCLAIREKALGRRHPHVAASLVNLALLYQEQRRYAEAERLLERSLAIRESALGREHAEVGTSLVLLVRLYEDQRRYAEAEVLQKRILAINQKARGPWHPHTATALDNLARVYYAQGRYAEAEPLFKRSLAISEKARGANHPDVANALNNLAELYQTQTRYAEAEPHYRRSLAISERALGLEHPEVGTSLNNLAELYRTQARYAEAELLYKRSLGLREKVRGPDHPEVADSLNNLALLYVITGRLDSAEPLLKRSLAIREKVLGPEHPEVGASLGNLASLYESEGRLAEADPLRRRDLTIVEKVLGPVHPTVATSLNNLAALHTMRSRYAEAEPLFRRSLAIREKALGPEHPDVGGSLNNLARLALDQGDWAQAADFWLRSTGVIQRRAQRGLAGAAEGASKGEAQRLSWQFAGLIKMTHLLPMQGRIELEAQGPATFETAQWAQGSEAAASLAQMAARSAKGSPELGLLVRERQDLVGEWQAKDKQLIAARSQEPAKRNAAAEKVLGDRLAAIDTRLAAIDARLAKDFPDYAALASPAPASVAEVQAELGADEALVLFLDTPGWKTTGSNSLPEETFIWVVTKTQARWMRSELGTAALSREVTALRCGLDATAWDGDGGEKCTKAVGGPRTQPLRFDHARAHKLYRALFGEVQDLIKGKHLLIVPSGPLTQLPFQVLVTREGVRPSRSDTIAQPSESGGTAKAAGGATVSDPEGPEGLAPSHRSIAWLAREHAITVLPAVSSLKALRRVGKSSTAPRPMIGIGNPLLDGPDARYADDSKQAQAKQRCPDRRPQQVARSDPRTGPARVEMRRGLADVADIKGQVPLPETADELCAVAEDVKADTGRDILLGAKATEREVKRLSAAGELAKYRMAHFATHGVLAGDLKGTSEPGLILTPPATATEEDDGYLSASEIAALKLDADWVILSACNTAAGAATSAEALSGLARAFIYAQARALLVSHWEVYSDATVKLITTAVREMARDPKVGRAEALRRSMLALIDNGAPHEAHPAYWAPFVVVGEGGQAR